MQEFAGRIAVVTGGASGIGLAAAEKFAAEGMKVVLADVESGALEAARKHLTERGADVLALETDVSKAESVEALARATLDHFGAVHVVMNNAGVGVAGTLWESPLPELEWALGVNLWGVIHGVRSFVPILLEQGVPGHVVNVASMAALTTAPFLDIYTASKHAVLSLTECLHKELAVLGSPVKASVVCPGLIKTRLMESERNRPGDSRSDPPRAEPSPGAAMMRDFLTKGTGTGWPPSAVADAIFDGIRDERFYIIPAQPEIMSGIDQRLDELRDRRNPVIAVPTLSDD